MSAFSLKVRGLNVGLVAFSLLVLGGSAYYMSKNTPVTYKSKAANVIEDTSGKLVKKGTPAFSPCKEVKTDYALVPECTPLSVESSIANPLVGKEVTATGTYQAGVFYATSLVKASK